MDYAGGVLQINFEVVNRLSRAESIKIASVTIKWEHFLPGLHKVLNLSRFESMSTQYIHIWNNIYIYIHIDVKRNLGQIRKSSDFLYCCQPP